MLDQVEIKALEVVPIIPFLENRDFTVEKLTESVYKVERFDELPIFIQASDGTLYFELDLGNVTEMASQDLYFKLLDLNTEILPVSVGIDSTNPEDPRLVLVESRETKNLDENELLSVIDAFEIATDKVENILGAYAYEKDGGDA